MPPEIIVHIIKYCSRSAVRELTLTAMEHCRTLLSVILSSNVYTISFRKENVFISNSGNSNKPINVKSNCFIDLIYTPIGSYNRCPTDRCDFVKCDKNAFYDNYFRPDKCNWCQEHIVMREIRVWSEINILRWRRPLFVVIPHYSETRQVPLSRVKQILCAYRLFCQIRFIVFVFPDGYLDWHTI